MSLAATILAGTALSSAASAQILNQGSAKPTSEEAAVRIDPVGARAAFLSATLAQASMTTKPSAADA